MQWAAIAILVCVALQRLGELVLDERNTSALMADSGVEFGARHYPLFLILHSSWLISLFAWTVWKSPEVHWILFGVYLLLQAARVWILTTLGRFWTTRIIIVPGAPLVTSGPYRFVRHPNYWIVIFEIALLPAVLGAWEIAVVFSLMNAALLFHRIRVENAALSPRR
ncbi:MAG: isoprenylcysteine carboxylmethyltransferase family protein [Rhodospirillaceae bacterium]|nr:isoprenylcysteine carboxylmethyltransferase family protein [Rhodospirillaceae bacterium]